MQKRYWTEILIVAAASLALTAAAEEINWDGSTTAKETLQKQFGLVHARLISAAPVAAVPAAQDSDLLPFPKQDAAILDDQFVSAFLSSADRLEAEYSACDDDGAGGCASARFAFPQIKVDLKNKALLLGGRKIGSLAAADPSWSRPRPGQDNRYYVLFAKGLELGSRVDPESMRVSVFLQTAP